MTQQYLDRYLIEEQLGEGSFAYVYRAKDTDLRRNVALKVLKPAWLSDRTAVKRFRQEARTMANLHHPNIAVIYDVGEADGQVYLAQFLVDGETLAQRMVRQGSLAWSEILNILRPVASALDYAHAQGVVHRDIKPTNILLDKNNQAFLSDFDLVRAAEGSASISASIDGVKGTASYIPPEVWDGQEATPSSDVYALSCVVFEMITGQVLFEGSSIMQVMRNHDRGPQFPEKWPEGVPDGTAAVLQRGLAQNPDHRISSAGELLSALTALTTTGPPVVEQNKPEETDVESAKDSPTIFVPTSPQEKAKVHPYVPEAQDLLQKGRISRRQFIYIATLLGCSTATAAAAAAGWSIWRQIGAETPTPGALVNKESTPTNEPTVTSTSTLPPESTSTSTPETISTRTSTGIIKRGGTWTSSMQLQLLDHPARVSWIEGANIIRQVGEYLTETGPDNITRPYLLERWEVAADLKTWDLYLRQGIKFNNGDELTADDVMFTFGEWLNPDVGSSMLGLLSYLNGMQNVEKVDDYHIRLHLQAPNIGVPEHLFHYPAIVLHRNFEGDIIRQPVGTGAFLLEDYVEGERAVFKRREDYWQIGEDGQSLPYLDELIYVSTDKDAGVAALQSGQIDALYDPRPSDFLTLKDHPDLTIRSASTSQALILRMRVDSEPWTDVRVRNALKMCQDRAQNLRLAYFGEGDLSIDAHVAPAHPAYCEKPIPEYDPEAARALLAEAGYPDGLTVTLATKNDQQEPELAQALKESATAGGFDIQLDITDPGGYWDRWTEVDLGITSWTHRPLDTMILPLGYTEEAIGAWNETRWTDDEFESLLREAQGTLDVETRRSIMCQIEDIMQERGPIGNSFWKKVWNITRSEFQNVRAHPNAYDLLYGVWKDT